MDSKIFNGWEIEGLYPGELDESMIKTIGQAAVQILGAKKVVVGKSDKITEAMAAALIDGLIEMGSEVIDIGSCTVSMGYFASNFLNAETTFLLYSRDREMVELIITGENAKPVSEIFPAGEIEALIKRWERGEGAPDRRLGGFVVYEDVLDDYTDSMIEALDFDVSKQGKVGVDKSIDTVILEILDRWKVDYQTDGSENLVFRVGVEMGEIKLVSAGEIIDENLLEGFVEKEISLKEDQLRQVFGDATSYIPGMDMAKILDIIIVLGLQSINRTGKKFKELVK